MATKAEKAAEQAEARETFKRFGVKPGSTIYTILESVSRSGMSRVIRVVVPLGGGDPRPGFVHPNHATAVLTGYKLASGHRDGVKVGGCGMDMGFHLVYSLSRALYPDGFGCIGDGCPSNDHSNGDRDYTPHGHRGPVDDGNRSHWHRNGGYALRQEWL